MLFSKNYYSNNVIFGKDKMNRIVSLCILAVVCSLFVSCKKNPAKKYEGDWGFVVDRSKLNVDSIGQYERDTVWYSGKISRGDETGLIVIQYLENTSIKLKIDESGTISEFPSQYSNGKFEDENNIHLYLRYGGLGGNITHIIDGTKLK